jgi:hypothetical protein
MLMCCGPRFYNFCQYVLVGISYNFADAGQGSDFFRSTLCVASRNNDLAERILAMDATDGCTGVLIGGGRYGTGVQHHDFGLGGSFGTFQSAVTELALDGRAIGLSSAAAKVLYIESSHRTIVA